MKSKEIIVSLETGKFDERLKEVYGCDALSYQKERYIKAASRFDELYGGGETYLFSVPGRSEISGNHTDHNNGKVLAAAVNRDIIAVVTPTDDGVIRVKGEGYSEDRIIIADTKTPDEKNFFKSRGLVAGMCAGFSERGYKVGGFTAYTTNNVLKGSGLSSSAAFECMIGNILNYLYNDGRIENAEIAKIAQFSENVYFGKPCGLMDQTACAVGGFVSIDFADEKNPIIKALDFDLTKKGYSLCIVNTGGNHADLNEDYASVPSEMKEVAAYFGKPVLRGLTESELIANMPILRKTVGDRAIMRAMHFIAENERVEAQTEALANGDIDGFFSGVLESGNSSYKYLQNVFTVKNVSEQGLSLAICITERITKGWGGAFRVHGGGFAGTIQAYIPHEKVDEYKAIINSVFGDGACDVLSVRPYGAIKVI